MVYQREIATEVGLQAGVDRVWDILTDFKQYRQWNTFLLEMKGRAEVGSKVCFVFELPRGFRFPACARVLDVKPSTALRWAGGIRGVFRAEHYFLLESVSATETRLHHGEIFTGVLVPLVWKLVLAWRGPPVYERMNQALKQRAEQQPQ